ncbi:hypothetical protein PHABIO_6 [Pseudomonas phage Phabio]|uniref:Uncharacterized protein n=1 Tax=Pseudomonas phage Phabio TaxID=2006668 RepID=A0A1Y0T1C3_9CAUD|nr:hypothetical protein MZD05_gp006 [Pseudomonas phage Phabio]ARV76637.1 hypothetical protein PHABIO_6 [Pseudomonas phage Phabio]
MRKVRKVKCETNACLCLFVFDLLIACAMVVVLANQLH